MFPSIIFNPLFPLILLPCFGLINCTDNVCFFFNCVFEIATGIDFVTQAELPHVVLLYIVYLCGLLGQRPHITGCKEKGDAHPLEEGLLQRMNCIFIFISTFKLFIQLFVVKDSHYCHIE